jgi:hypothetical protein
MKFQSMDEFDPELEEKLRSFSRTTVERDSAVAENTRQMFLAEISKLAVSNPPVSRLTFQNFIPALNQFRKVRLKMSPSLTSLVLAVLMFFGGGTASVAAAQSSLPDDTLYPVKVLSEQIEEALTFQPEKKLDLAVNQSGKRLDEISSLIANGSVPKEEVLARLQASLEKALKLSSETGKTDSVELLELLTRLQEEMKRMEKMPTGVNPPPEDDLARAREKMQDQIKMVDENIKAPVPNTPQQQVPQAGPTPEAKPTKVPGQIPAANPDLNSLTNPNPVMEQKPSGNQNPVENQNPVINPLPDAGNSQNATQVTPLPTPQVSSEQPAGMPNTDPNKPKVQGSGPQKDNRFMATPMPTPAL